MLNLSGIYKITNKINGKSYIGLSKNINRRWRQHKDLDSHSTDKNLYWAFKEFGIENFEFEVLKECEPSKLGYWERKYIKEYDTYRTGYNSTLGGEGAQSLTLKDKYDLSIHFSVEDRLTYKSYTFEDANYKKFFFKSQKLNKKLNNKKMKLTEKDKTKKLARVETRFTKRIKKVDGKKNYWNDSKQTIILNNYEKQSSLVNPMKGYILSDVSELDEYSTSEYLKSVNMVAVKIRRFQKNNIKYKELYLEDCLGDVIFKGNKLIYKLEGAKNMETELEMMRDIRISCIDSGYTVDFNNSWNTFSILNNTTLRYSDTFYYPKGNVVTFKTLSGVKIFLTTLRKTLGI